MVCALKSSIYTEINYRNRVYHLYKSVPFTEKQPRRPETDTKNCVEVFPLAYSVRKNRATFSDVQLLPEIFRWNDPKSSNPFTTFQHNFRETFCKCVVVFIRESQNWGISFPPSVISPSTMLLSCAVISRAGDNSQILSMYNNGYYCLVSISLLHSRF